MMNDDMPEIFRRMDAMMARMMDGMEAGEYTGFPPGMMGYRIVIHGGDFPPEARGPGSTRPRDGHEPLAEVHRIGDEVKVIAELPGVTEASLRLDMKGGTLVIDAGDADRHYHTAAEVPGVDPASLHRSLKNGVLEVTFKVIPGGPETSGGAGA